MLYDDILRGYWKATRSDISGFLGE